MAELPNGIVTFFFTDIEGSTGHWQRDAVAMAVAHARHDALLTELIERSRGLVVRSRGEGDSFFAVFHRISDAVSAARDVQLALLREAWPTSQPLRVRIGVHTGEADLRGGDYFGVAVNRCARLRDLAHGGQILLSQAVHDLLRDAPIAGIDLLDLGEHRLKDLIQPERVFQLIDPDLLADFPPLRAPAARLHNLPAPSTTFIGRDLEIGELTVLLRREATRLVTVTGPGGIGKTRLAIEVARRLAEQHRVSVAFADLAPIADPALVAHAVAGALSVRERVDRPLLETVGQALRSTELLLVLDNCEHLIDSCATVADTLRRVCPSLRILATSREPLGISGEVIWSVPLLTIGSDRAGGAPVPGGAQQLFVERVQDRAREFTLDAENGALVGRICRRLNGLPLAIELAAARIPFLSPSALLPRLDHQLPLLVGGPRDAPPRQRTIRATIGWSYDLLSNDERVVFRRLGVFPSGFSLAAAEAVGAVRPSAASPRSIDVRGTDERAGPRREEVIGTLDTIESLLAKNLLRREHSQDEPRFSMLQTIREFAHEQLTATGEFAAVRARCAAYLLTLAEEAGERLLGPDQLRWFGRLDAELDNLRAVFGWSRDGEVDGEFGLRLAGALVMYWELRGLAIEGNIWVNAMLALPHASERTPARAGALYSAAFLAAMRGNFVAQRSLAEESAAIFLAAGRRREGGRALAEQAVAETRLGDLPTARALLTRSAATAREVDDRWGLAFALSQLGGVALQQGDLAESRRLRTEAASIARAVNDRHTLGLALAGLAQVARMQGQLGESADLFAETLRVSSGLRDQWIAPRALAGLAGAALLAGEPARAARLFGAVDAMRAASGIDEAARAFRDQAASDQVAARAALGHRAFAEAHAAGLAMETDQVIAYALRRAT